MPAAIGELFGQGDDVGLEELRLVDPNHPRVVVHLGAQSGRIRNGDGGKADFPVRRNRLDGVPVVERGLESLDREARVSRLVQPPDQLLRLSAEHAAADQVQAARRLVEPNLLERLRPGFSRVMAPAYREEPFGGAIHDLESLRPAGQVTAAWLVRASGRRGGPHSRAPNRRPPRPCDGRWPDHSAPRPGGRHTAAHRPP